MFGLSSLPFDDPSNIILTSLKYFAIGIFYTAKVPVFIDFLSRFGSEEYIVMGSFSSEKCSLNKFF